MTFCVSICLQVMLAGGLWGSATQGLDPEVLLAGYNLCNQEFETIAYDLETDLQSPTRRLVYTVRHCSRNDSKQWIGQRTLYKYDEHGSSQPAAHERVAAMYDATRLAHLFRDAPEDHPEYPPRASLYGPSGGLLPKLRREWAEDIMLGGPLVGKVAGSDHHSVYDLLKGASHVTLHDTAAKVLDYDAYLLEADTRYGRVKAWISPDAGSNCLKWEIAKARNQFYRDGEVVELQATDWVAAYEAERVERIEGRYLTTEAKFEIAVTNGDVEIRHFTQYYKLTNIDFDPDYEAMGAFTIQLPEGTVVGDQDLPGVTYRWIGGQLVTGPAQTPMQATKEEAAPAAESARSEPGEDQDISPVSKSNIVRHVQALTALQSRDITHPGNKQAEEYIIRELREYGYSPSTDSFRARNMTLHNVISDSSDKKKPVVLLSAHFDSASSGHGNLSLQAPGADDNASGVAALLELARILKQYRIQRNFECVFFNCEEIDALGSKHLSNRYGDNDWQIDYVINIDTIGTWNGPLSKTCPVNYVTDDNSMGVIEQLQKQFPYPLRKAKTMWRDDSARFWSDGFEAIEITEDGCTPHMHKPTDTAEKLDYDNIAKIVHGLYVVLNR